MSPRSRSSFKNIATVRESQNYKLVSYVILNFIKRQLFLRRFQGARLSDILFGCLGFYSGLTSMHPIQSDQKRLIKGGLNELYV